jgi:hypothetical protein
VTIFWICSSVALGWAITIILLVRDHQNDVSKNFLQAWIQRRSQQAAALDVSRCSVQGKLIASPGMTTSVPYSGSEPSS